MLVQQLLSSLHISNVLVGVQVGLGVVHPGEDLLDPIVEQLVTHSILQASRSLSCPAFQHLPFSLQIRISLGQRGY